MFNRARYSLVYSRGGSDMGAFERRIRKKTAKEILDSKYLDILIKEAQTYGLCEHTIKLDGLELVGLRFVYHLIDDEDFRDSFEDDAPTYYYNLVARAMYGGIFAANDWASSDLTDELDTDNYYDVVYEPGFLDSAHLIVKTKLGYEQDEWEEIRGNLCINFFKFMEPYWQSKILMEKTFNIMHAFFRLGYNILLNAVAEFE